MTGTFLLVAIEETNQQRPEIKTQRHMAVPARLCSGWPLKKRKCFYAHKTGNE
jgi:hypothetical protein